MDCGAFGKAPFVAARCAFTPGAGGCKGGSGGLAYGRGRRSRCVYTKTGRRRKSSVLTGRAAPLANTILTNCALTAASWLLREGTRFNDRCVGRSGDVGLEERIALFAQDGDLIADCREIWSLIGPEAGPHRRASSGSNMPRSGEVGREIGADKLDELTAPDHSLYRGQIFEPRRSGLGRDRRPLCRRRRRGRRLADHALRRHFGGRAGGARHPHPRACRRSRADDPARQGADPGDDPRGRRLLRPL